MISRPSPSAVAKSAGQRGQISIFFASSLLVLISIIAFVINIGMFVKAKINLQNATDAGAYAGAAVQARMLTRIGYMNWEMRNNFKEWMFKYYVLGNLNIDDVESPPAAGNMRFTMRPDPNLSAALGGTDIYNFPSVCLHYAGVPTNVCRRYAIPGIPRFEPTNLVGIDETTSSFIDAIVKEKSSDCSKRTQLNFNVTNMWAYNLYEGNDTAANSAFIDAPQIAATRIGAWPKGVELAIRTRNLEFAVNRPPVSAGVCNPDASEGAPGCVSVSTLESEKHYGNERPIKAYWSAMRNLGSDLDNELRASYTLFELAPTPVELPSAYDLNAMLMSSAARAQGKHYLDLNLQLLNYATFFTALIARSDTLTVQGQNVAAEGACDVSKIAIPVPGFPLGFYKNPDVLTYYAVRGEAKFLGLFNPFRGPVKLTAWAAAKPMGGRIGPALFTPASSTKLKSREMANKKRSTAYISGINLENLPRKGGGGTVPLGQYAPGMPIPINMNNNVSGRFWVGDPADEVGGWVTGQDTVFGVPNLVYDFELSDTTAATYHNSSQNTNIIQPTGPPEQYAAGLYKASQFTKFKNNLAGVATADDIDRSISRVRAPTRYEAANYTVPVPSDLSVSEQIDGGYMDTFGFITGEARDGTRYAQIYAPLFGDMQDAMYRNASEVVSAIHEFMNFQTGAMRKYRDSMNRVALRIFSDDPVKYRDAAERISDFNFSLDPSNANPASCKSINGTFLWFYFGGENAELDVASNVGCPKSFKVSIEEYFNSRTARFNPTSHLIEYHYDPNTMQGLQNFSQLLTGYMPGVLRGASNTGLFTPPFSNTSGVETMRRTGYSTKLVQLRSLTSSGNYGGAATPFAVYSEGNPTPLPIDVRQSSFRNALDLSGVPSSVNH